MTFVDPKTFPDDDLLHIIETNPNPAHIMRYTPQYQAWLQDCMAEAKERNLFAPYRYTLRSTGGNSRKYGHCEVCGEYASEVFSQAKEERFGINGETFWAFRSTTFGHKKCLLKIRK